MTTRTFHIENFGCRATQADAASVLRQLRQCGYEHVDRGQADVCVLNTCTVTAAADAQAREAIRQIHRANPTARILVMGCYAQRAPEELARMDGVSWVVGNSHRTEIATLVDSPASPDFFPLAQLDRELYSLARGPAKILTGDIFEQTELGPDVHAGADGDHTRPILKIQDGCDSRCAYCVIPFVRGRSRSLPPSEVVGEVRRLIAGGAREVVLSGINLGSYGRDLEPRAEFSEVLRWILDETELERLRVSSIEPMDVTADLVDLFASTPRLARHFHVPLQSGSDRILTGMHRWYRAAHYAQRIELIAERLPGAGIGADVIAGFPGETNEDHRTTLQFIENLPFTYLHVFSFSPRPGTKAHDLPGQLPADVIRCRARELRARGAEKAAMFRARQAGRTIRILTLKRRGEGWTEGLSDNYLRVRVPGRLPANEWQDARVSLAGGILVADHLHGARPGRE